MWGRLCLWGCLWAQRQASPASNTLSVDRGSGCGHPRERPPARFPLRTWEPCTPPLSGHVEHAANHSSLGLFLTHGGQVSPSRGGPEPRTESPRCLRRGCPQPCGAGWECRPARATAEVSVLLGGSWPCRPPAPPEGPGPTRGHPCSLRSDFTAWRWGFENDREAVGVRVSGQGSLPGSSWVLGTEPAPTPDSFSGGKRPRAPAPNLMG